MAQYWGVIVRGDDGRQDVLYPDCGMRLRDHMWYGTPFIEQVLDALRGEPKSVAWIGDYSGEDIDYELHPRFSPDDYEAVWACGDDGEELPGLRDWEPRGFLVNADRGVFIDLAEHYGAEPAGASGDRVHPLPLLCAIGNDRGGGDYVGINMARAGEWAFDRLAFRDEEPVGYGKIPADEYLFVDRR